MKKMTTTRRARMNKYGIMTILALAFLLGNCEKDKPAAAGELQNINKDNAKAEAKKLIDDIKGL